MTTISAICIGDELLDGRVRDANTAFLGKFLEERGYALTGGRLVPDSHDAICAALDQASGDLVIVSGGLGPTADDITREAAARWAGRALEEDAETIERMRRRFEERGYPFTENNRSQACFPAGADVLDTSVGSAAGFRVDRDDVTAFFFPGVPREFRWFAETYLTDRLGYPSEKRRTRLHFHGLGESVLETRLEGVEELAGQLDGKVGYRANYPIIELKLTAGGDDELRELREFVLDRVGPWMVAEEDETLPARVGRLLECLDATVTVAESCTAGGIAAAITDIPGSSGWFERGYVTYANEAKIDELGVCEKTLERHGAVSPQVVCQMAVGARRRADANYAMAVSGIAGPTGGTPEKPVGTVHFALATREGTFHRRVHFRLGSRDLIRRGTVYSALAFLLWRLEARLEDHESVTGPHDDDQVCSEYGLELPE